MRLAAPGCLAETCTDSPSNIWIENSSRNSNKSLLGRNYFSMRFKGAESRMWEGHDKGHSAEAQAATEDMDFGLLALYVDNRFAPVNLYGFTRIEVQRNKGFCWFIL